MAIELQTPIGVNHPEIPYTQVAVSFSTAPLWITDPETKSIIGMEGAASLKLVPYRTLPGGALDKLSDDDPRCLAFSSGQIFADAAQDPAMAAFVTGFLALVDAYKTAKGH
jgi:hypothetical protein